MSIEQPLFESEHICLGPIDYDKDPEIESRWTHDAYYQRMVDFVPARPLSAAQIKKKYESIEKEMEEKNNRFYFTIRLKEDDRLVGFGEIEGIDWSNGAARVRLGIGGEQDRGCGYGSEALRLLLRFAFGELNLYRLSAAIPEYNDVALHLFRKAGFVDEVCRREAVYRDGRRWAIIQAGLLREEWQP